MTVDQCIEYQTSLRRTILDLGRLYATSTGPTTSTSAGEIAELSDAIDATMTRIRDVMRAEFIKPRQRKGGEK